MGGKRNVLYTLVRFGFEARGKEGHGSGIDG